MVNKVASKSSARLSIDLSAIARNYQFLDSQGSFQTACAVKADAYGLGMVSVAPALEQAGCRLFFVATLEEGIALRALLPDCEIAILGGLYRGAESEYTRHNLIPVLNTPDDIARAQGQQSVILHFDTGMNRLGLRATDFDWEQMAALPPLRAVMSHLACADEIDHTMNEAQRLAFDDVCAHFTPETQRSFANSAGIFHGTSYHYDIARPGMALYGLNPTPHTDNPMHDVVSLSVRVLQVCEAKAGESIGYSATHYFDKDTPIATVAFGYADGILRSLSHSSALYWRGYKLPILGRVSMDLVSVDLSAVPESERPLPHDWVEFIGPNQTADDIARDANTIGYEILTSLGARYERTYQ